METTERIMLILLKDFLAQHTISSLAKEAGLSRVGTWKIVKRLEAENLAKLKPVGYGKTSAYTITLNWSNILTEKNLEISLVKETQKNQRWADNFKDLEKHASFLILFGSILHSPREAGDIDILIMADKSKFIEINDNLSRIQKTQVKKIHSTNLMEMELREELKKPNQAVVEALKNGVVLFGHRIFIKFAKNWGKQ